MRDIGTGIRGIPRAWIVQVRPTDADFDAVHLAVEKSEDPKIEIRLSTDPNGGLMVDLDFHGLHLADPQSSLYRFMAEFFKNYAIEIDKHEEGIYCPGAAGPEGE